MSDAPRKLDYATDPRRARRRVRLAVILVALAAAGFGGWHWTPGWRARAAMLYWQRKCLTYAPPPDRVVFEESPDEGRRLMASGLPYSEFGGGVGYYCFYEEPCWNRAPCGGWAPVAFFHELKSTGGNRRLVALLIGVKNVERQEGKLFASQLLFVKGIVPATWSTDARKRSPKADQGISVLHGARQPLRFYTGRADPSDSSHFTVDYQLAEHRGAIDVWYQDDDHIRLEPRGAAVVEWPTNKLNRTWWLPGTESTPLEPDAKVGQPLGRVN